MNQLALEAATFRRLLAHLQNHSEIQNIDLMIHAGFCRNCLADWYQEAASASGSIITQEQAREEIYGMPFAEWKKLYQKEATAEQIAAFERRQRQRKNTEIE